MIRSMVGSIVPNAPWLKIIGWLGTTIPTLFLATTLHAEHQLSSPQFLPGSGIEMELTNFYEDIPPAGFLPLRVQVKNGSGAARSWELQTVHTKYGIGSTQGVFALRVEARSERTFDLLVPLTAEASSSSRYSNLQIIVSGYAVTDGGSSEHSSGGGKTPTAFLGMGEALSVKHWGGLRDALDKKSSSSLDGTPLDTALLPADWRALAGFGMIIFSDDEWRHIPAAPRTALLDWVSQGGRLVIQLGGPVSAELPSEGPLGAGKVEHWPTGGDFVEQVRAALPEVRPSSVTAALENYDWRWKMAADVGRPEPPQVLIMAFVILFAIIIGPLNFLVFAPGGNRHRLFWTTPLISIAASVLMGVFILLSEGLGGSGRRFQLLINLPGENKNVVWQEQVARTGVLTSSAFTISEPALPAPINLRKNNTGMHASMSREIGRTYRLDGATWSGDWFRSRSTQAQLFTSVESTRARIEIMPGTDGNPVAISSFEHPLVELWYYDAGGKAWHAKDFRPGERKSLAKGKQGDFNTWWKTALEPAGFATSGVATTFRGTDIRGKFFASTASPNFLSSLPAIRWTKGTGIILGQPAQ